MGHIVGDAVLLERPVLPVGDAREPRCGSGSQYGDTGRGHPPLMFTDSVCIATLMAGDFHFVHSFGPENIMVSAVLILQLRPKVSREVFNASHSDFAALYG
jgi:hypothetical protein